MPTCLNCGASVPEGAVACGRCGTTLNAQLSMASTSSESQPSSSPQQPQESGPLTMKPEGDLSMRLEKALRRCELLGYAAIVLGLIILVIILIAA